MLAERIPQLARNERVAGWTGFLWGFAEGLFFFIVPDVYVTFATLFSIRAGATAWIASIAETNRLETAIRAAADAVAQELDEQAMA